MMSFNIDNVLYLLFLNRYGPVSSIENINKIFSELEQQPNMCSFEIFMEVLRRAIELLIGHYQLDIIDLFNRCYRLKYEDMFFHFCPLPESIILEYTTNISQKSEQLISVCYELYSSPFSIDRIKLSHIEAYSRAAIKHHIHQNNRFPCLFDIDQSHDDNIYILSNKILIPSEIYRHPDYILLILICSLIPIIKLNSVLFNTKSDSEFDEICKAIATEFATWLLGSGINISRFRIGSSNTILDDFKYYSQTVDLINRIQILFNFEEKPLFEKIYFLQSALVFLNSLLGNSNIFLISKSYNMRMNLNKILEQLISTTISEIFDTANLDVVFVDLMKEIKDIRCITL